MANLHIKGDNLCQHLKEIEAVETLLELSGAWNDSRRPDEIVAEIRQGRKSPPNIEKASPLEIPPTGEETAENFRLTESRAGRGGKKVG